MKPRTLVIIFILCFNFSCGSSGDDNNDNISSTQSAQILYMNDPNIECESTLLVETQQIEYHRNVKSVIDKTDVYLAFFSSAGSGDYVIHYLNFEKTSLLDYINVSNTSVIQVDHSRDLQIGFTTDFIPLVMYQGGSYPTCGATEQSDIMLSMLENDTWQEYTISIGTVERNPVIHNGLVGYSSDMIVDSTNTTHMCFQFLYEGCDSMNYNYPDLWYIQCSPDHLSGLSNHEVVEGNDYENLNMQNNAGEHCAIALDHNNVPFIFYYFEGAAPNKDHGLRLAYRNYQDSWETQWIDKDIHVDSIHAAWNANQEKMAVAYYVTQNAYGCRNNVLMYAEQSYNEWQSIVVDKSCYCGNYCSLTFDNNGEPIIAYRADKTRSQIPLNHLKIARRKSGVWKRFFCNTNNSGTVKNLGIDNTIHVENNSIYITSFSGDTHRIYLLTLNMEHIE